MSRLGRSLLQRLSAEHRVRVASLEGPGDPPAGAAEVVTGDLMDPDTAWRAVRGVEAVVHTGHLHGSLPADSISSHHAWLDQASRGMAVLLQAVVDARIPRFVLCSTLELFRRLPDDTYVVEHRRPQPGTDTGLLCHHLAEQVTREYAREHDVAVTVLRLGQLVDEDDLPPDAAADPMWLDPRDAAAAVELALARRARSDRLHWLPRWMVRHICCQPPHPKYLIDAARGMGFEPRHNFEGRWRAQPTAAAAPPDPGRAAASAPARRPASKGRKRVLFLGASGLVGPYLTPGLEAHYDVRLTDVHPHPEGRDVERVDVRSYEQVLEAARGVDAIVNFTVVRNHPVDSFHVNTLGAWNVMRAAAELGIDRVVHSGPQAVRTAYDHDFDVEDAPAAPGTGYYGLSKWLSAEICRLFAREHGIQTAYFVFNGLGPAPEPVTAPEDAPTFRIVWEDLAHACRLFLESASIPGDFQLFNMMSFHGPEIYNFEKARRMIGFEPTQDWDACFRRRAAS